MDIIAVAGYVSAIVTIFGGICKLISMINKISRDIDRFNEQLDKNTLYIMKLALFNEQLPLVDRLHAGEIYLEKGGNGLGKKKYEELLKEVK